MKGFIDSRLIQLGVDVPAPATTNGLYRLIGVGVIVANTGDEDVIINDFWRLPQGDTLQLAASFDSHVLDITLKIAFDGTGADPYVQFMTLGANLPGRGNYVTQ